MHRTNSSEYKKLWRDWLRNTELYTKQKTNNLCWKKMLILTKDAFGASIKLYTKENMWKESGMYLLDGNNFENYIKLLKERPLN